MLISIEIRGRIRCWLLLALLSTAFALLQPPALDDHPQVRPTKARFSPVQLSSEPVGREHREKNLCVSADGRFSAFDSSADDLVAGDTNGQQDVFLRNEVSGEVRCVSIDLDGRPGNGFSCQPAISADGRYVAFQSQASNLVSGDDNGSCDVFVFDALEGTVVRVSVSTAGTEANCYSFVVPGSAYFRQGEVEFRSLADNLVEGDDNGVSDTFVHRLHDGVTIRRSP